MGCREGPDEPGAGAFSPVTLVTSGHVQSLIDQDDSCLQHIGGQVKLHHEETDRWGTKHPVKLSVWFLQKGIVMKERSWRAILN